jgi:hypothetical protein
VLQSQNLSGREGFRDGAESACGNIAGGRSAVAVAPRKVRRVVDCDMERNRIMASQYEENLKKSPCHRKFTTHCWARDAHENPKTPVFFRLI